MMRTPIDMSELLSEIEVPDLSGAQLALKEIQAKRQEADIFAEKQRKGWKRKWKPDATSHRAHASHDALDSSFYRTGRNLSMGVHSPR